MKQCVLITDNKIGHIGPVKGLSEALSHFIPLEITPLQLQQKHDLFLTPLWFFRLFPHKIPALLNHIIDVEALPDLIIGNSRLSVKICALLRLYAHYSLQKCFFVQLHNPRISPHYFDHIIAPLHDKMSGKSIINTVGSLNSITEKTLKEAYIPKIISSFPTPLVAVCIGGASSRYSLTEAEAIELAHHIKVFQVQNNCSLMITPSRRTGKKADAILRDILKGDSVYFWDSKDCNPYLGFLQKADYAIITSDSVNMLSEAATAGVPILLYRLKGKAGKFEILYQSLIKRGYLQEFSYAPCFQKVSPLQETKRVANALHPLLQAYWKDNET